jgi:hypothetical protein
MGGMEKINSPEPNPLKSEHLINRAKPIIACIGSFEDFITEFTVLNKGTENIDWNASKKESEEKGILSAGEYTYVISPLDEKDKRSYGLSNCTGVVVVGQDKKNTDKNLSFISHQYWSKLAKLGPVPLLPSFLADLNTRLSEVKERCVSGTIDAVIVGGTYFTDSVYKKNYEDAIDVLSQNIKNAFGFEPVVITGPKINDEEKEEDILLDTKNRQLYIERPEVGDTSSESYLPSDFEEQEKKWRPKRKEDHPFTKLEESDLKGVSSKLFRVVGYKDLHEDLVVRKSFVNVPDEEDEKAPKMTIHERAEYLRNKTVEFKKIIDRIGIRMAETTYIVGTDPTTSAPALFGATERIKGESLQNLKVLDKETADKVDALYAKIISDLADSYLHYDNFWYDPKNAQFVFGTTEKDSKPDVYLVDVDPNIMKWGPPDLNHDERDAKFWDRLDMFVLEMEKMEKKVKEKGFKFCKSRAMINMAIEKFNSQ